LANQLAYGPSPGKPGYIFKACGAMTTPPWGVIIINKHRRYSKDTRFGSKPSSRCCDFGARTGDPPPPGGRGCIHIRIEVLITTAVWGTTMFWVKPDRAFARTHLPLRDHLHGFFEKKMRVHLHRFKVCTDASSPPCSLSWFLREKRRAHLLTICLVCSYSGSYKAGVNEQDRQCDKTE
jgi:hypothetical protein